MARVIPLVAKEDCEKCGLTHGKCHGHTSAGRPCGIMPPDRSVMCARRHGASAPKVKAAIERRVEKAELQVVLRKWDLEQEDDEHPALTLSREARRLKARLGYLDSIVNSPGYDEEYEDKLGVLRRTPLSEAYSDEQKQLTALARDMARLGLDAEALQLEKARPSREQGEFLKEAMVVVIEHEVLAGLGITAEQKHVLYLALEAKIRAGISA